MESLKVLELQTGKIEIESAFAWSRGGANNKVVKEAEVSLMYNGDKYTIKEHKVVWKILRTLDSDLPYSEYSEIVNANPLREILEEYFSHYNEVVAVMILDDVICAVVENDDAAWVEANSVALERVRAYCEGKLGCGLATKVFVMPEGIYYRITHTDEVRHIEIIQMEKSVKVRARYEMMKGYMQPIDPTIFKGMLALLEAERFFSVLDEVIQSLKKLDTPMWHKREVLAVKSTSSMKPKEQDALERAWFRNSFVNSNE